MEHKTEEGSDPPPTEQLNEDVDMNQAASSAGASEATALPPSTCALTPATTQAVETTTPSMGPSPGTNTSQGNSLWGKGLVVNAIQHIPDDSDTTAEAMHGSCHGGTPLPHCGGVE